MAAAGAGGQVDRATARRSHALVGEVAQPGFQIVALLTSREAPNFVSETPLRMFKWDLGTSQYSKFTSSPKLTALQTRARRTDTTSGRGRR